MARDLLMERSQAARLAFFERERDRFEKLITSGQSPDMLIIVCSDSRIVDARLLGAEPGEVFVVRVLGAAVPPYGAGQSSVGAALEYAIGALRVQHVVVCGHTHCGAVKALDTPFDLQRTPNLAGWLEHLRPAQTSIDARMSFAEPASRHLAIVEQSVLDQLRNLETYPMVREALAQKRVQLHGWVYNLEIGRLSYFDSDAGRFVVEGSEPGNPDNR